MLGVTSKSQDPTIAKEHTRYLTSMRTFSYISSDVPACTLNLPTHSTPLHFLVPKPGCPLSFSASYQKK